MKLTLKNKNDVDLAKKQLDSLVFKTKTGKKITHRFECVKNINRTLNQNSYYWLCLRIFGNECGHTKDELHEIFKTMFCENYPEHRNFFANKIEAFGVVTTISLSTTKLNSTVFTKYIEFIRNFASSEGCYIPESNEIPDSLRY